MDSTAVRNKDTDTHKPEGGKHMQAAGRSRQQVAYNTHTLGRRRRLGVLPLQPLLLPL
jgi:hypothetical protein